MVRPFNRKYMGNKDTFDKILSRVFFPFLLNCDSQWLCPFGQVKIVTSNVTKAQDNRSQSIIGHM